VTSWNRIFAEYAAGKEGGKRVYLSLSLSLFFFSPLLLLTE
jgi:hypothetical protein